MRAFGIAFAGAASLFFDAKALVVTLLVFSVKSQASLAVTFRVFLAPFTPQFDCAPTAGFAICLPVFLVGLAPNAVDFSGASESFFFVGFIPGVVVFGGIYFVGLVPGVVLIGFAFSSVLLVVFERTHYAPTVQPIPACFADVKIFTCVWFGFPALSAGLQGRCGIMRLH